MIEKNLVLDNWDKTKKKRFLDKLWQKLWELFQKKNKIKINWTNFVLEFWDILDWENDISRKIKLYRYIWNIKRKEHFESAKLVKLKNWHTILNICLDNIWNNNIFVNINTWKSIWNVKLFWNNDSCIWYDIWMLIVESNGWNWIYFGNSESPIDNLNIVFDDVINFLSWTINFVRLDTMEPIFTSKINYKDCFQDKWRRILKPWENLYISRYYEIIALIWDQIKNWSLNNYFQNFVRDLDDWFLKQIINNNINPHSKLWNVIFEQCNIENGFLKTLEQIDKLQESTDNWLNILLIIEFIVRLRKIIHIRLWTKTDNQHLSLLDINETRIINAFSKIFKLLEKYLEWVDILITKNWYLKTLLKLKDLLSIFNEVTSKTYVIPISSILWNEPNYKNIFWYWELADIEKSLISNYCFYNIDNLWSWVKSDYYENIQYILWNIEPFKWNECEIYFTWFMYILVRWNIWCRSLSIIKIWQKYYYLDCKIDWQLNLIQILDIQECEILKKDENGTTLKFSNDNCTISLNKNWIIIVNPTNLSVNQINHFS